MSAPIEVDSRRVIYRGRVQGVGFRFTARRIAQRFPVGGYVRNLSDGTVELVAAGERADIRDFLNAVASAMQGNIAQAEESPGPSGIDPSQFEIRN